MPPVAQRERTGLTDIVERLLKERGLSFREFAKRVAEVKGTTRDGEKTTIARQMERFSAEDESFEAWAAVLEVPRSTFPPSPQPLTTPHLDLRLRQLEEMIGPIEEGRTVSDLLEELATTAAGTLERIGRLESHDGHGEDVPTVTP